MLGPVAALLPAKDNCVNLQGVKVAIARGLTSPALGRLIAWWFRDRIPSNGMIFETDDPIVGAETKAYLFWRLYERAELRFVRQLMRTDLDVVELGSSLGVLACAIRRKLPPERRLICVEADPRLLAPLQANLRRNSDRPATVVHAAIDHSGAEHVMIAFGHVTTEGAVVETLEGRIGASVPACRLDVLLSNQGVQGDFVLVCDIEGAEAGLIAHEQATLARCQQLIIEVHDTRCAGQEVKQADLIKWLCEHHGFRHVTCHAKSHVLSR